MLDRPPPGYKTPLHAHPYMETITVLEGQGEALAAGCPRPRPVRAIRRATRKRYSAGEKIRIVLDGLRNEHSIAELCRREGIAEGLYYSWSRSSSKPASHTACHRDRVETDGPSLLRSLLHHP
jgi:hypothetical protein